MKKILLLIIPFLFLIIPRDTFAKTLSMRPDWYQIYDNNERITDGAPQGWTLYSNNYDTFAVGDTSQAVSKINWIYTSKWTQELNKGYDISFKIYQPNISVANLEGFNGGKPLVSLENKTCFVDYTSSSFTGGVQYGATFNVYCPNVTFSSKTFHVYVNSPPANTNFSLYGVRYGISQSWDISPTNDNSGLESSIDRNTEEQEETNNKLDDLNDNITNSDSSGATDSAGSFFEDFENDSHGLSGVITAPLTFIQSLLGHSCQPLTFDLPFVDKEVSLPCIKPIYQEYFGLFFNLYQVITTGIIAYAVGIRIFATVKGLQDPQYDKIEVLKL